MPLPLPPSQVPTRPLLDIPEAKVPAKNPIPTAKPVPLPAPPVARAVGPGSAPVPVAAPVPLASAVAPGHDSPGLAPPSDFISPRLRRGKTGPVWVKWLPLLFVGFFLSLGAGLAVGFWDQVKGFLAGGGGGGIADGSGHESTHLGYQFTFPTRFWKEDVQNRLDLKCGIAWARNDPNGWMAILTHDYKKQTPTEADLVEECVRRLREYFIKDESRDFFEFQVDPGREYKLGDRPAVRMEFKAEAKSVTMGGEVFMMGHNGVGFWFVTWGPKVYEDGSREEWAKLRGNFRLTKHRDGWTGAPAERLATVEGTKVGYRLVYNDIVWDTDDPMNYDGTADMLLLGEDVNEKEKKEQSAYKGAKRAYAALLVLPKADDLAAAVTMAKDHLLEQQKKDYPRTAIEDPDDGSSIVTGRTEIGSEPGHLLRLKVRNDQGRVRLVYLGVVRQIEQTLVLELECGWDHRTYWDINFQQLLRRFTTKKGK